MLGVTDWNTTTMVPVEAYSFGGGCSPFSVEAIKQAAKQERIEGSFEGSSVGASSTCLYD